MKVWTPSHPSRPAVTHLALTAVQRLTGLEPFPQPPVIPLRLPVVLMHGFGLLAVIRRKGHLHDTAMHLRAHGVRAYAPNVAPYETIATRAAMWAERIRHVLAETGAPKVHLIAHSMGGLDARYLISRLGFHPHVASLTTIATPHRGTAIADVVLQQPERLRDWAAEIVDWLGANALADGTSNVRQAVHELTPAYVEGTFNPSTPDHPDVRYASYGGQAGKGTSTPINPFLKPLNVLLYHRQGVNDGYVPVSSAQWGTYRGTLEADHLRQIGIQMGSGGSFDAGAFFASLVRHLAAEGG